MLVNVAKIAKVLTHAPYFFVKNVDNGAFNKLYVASGFLFGLYFVTSRKIY